jgi:hypothetical protein
VEAVLNALIDFAVLLSLLAGVYAINVLRNWK